MKRRMQLGFWILDFGSLLAIATPGCTELRNAQREAALQTRTVVQQLAPLSEAFATASENTAANKHELHRQIITMKDAEFATKLQAAAKTNPELVPQLLSQHLAERDQETYAIAVDRERQAESRRLFRQGIAEVIHGVELATAEQVNAIDVQDAFGGGMRKLFGALVGAGSAVSVTALAGGL